LEEQKLEIEESRKNEHRARSEEKKWKQW